MTRYVSMGNRVHTLRIMIAHSVATVLPSLSWFAQEAQKLTASWQTLRMLINEEHDVSVSLSKAKAGVLVDRIVIKPLY